MKKKTIKKPPSMMGNSFWDSMGHSFKNSLQAVSQSSVYVNKYILFAKFKGTVNCLCLLGSKL